MTSRNRQIEFIESFGPEAMLHALTEAFRSAGPDWLTDEQIQDIANNMASDWKRIQRRNRRNREILRGCHE